VIYILSNFNRIKVFGAAAGSSCINESYFIVKIVVFIFLRFFFFYFESRINFEECRLLAEFIRNSAS